MFDVEAMEVKDFTDSFADGDAPPTDFEVLELSEEAIESRAPLSHVEISQPGGTNFTITGSQVEWQNWQFHLRFDPRQGTILNRVGYVEDEGFRSIAYEIAMSEMFVPTRTPTRTGSTAPTSIWVNSGSAIWRPSSKAATARLTPFIKTRFVSGEGEPFTAPNRICILRLTQAIQYGGTMRTIR